MSFPDDGCAISLNGDPHFGDIDGDKGAVVLPRKHTTRFYRFAAPAVEAEDAVGFRDRVPALDVGELASIGLAGADLPAVEIAPEGLTLVLLKIPSPHPHA